MTRTSDAAARARRTLALRGALAALALGAVGTVASGAIAVADPGQVGDAPIEAGRCDTFSADRRPADSLRRRRIAGDTITVQVPATAVVRLDPTGRIVSAMTNTGCAPRPTDDAFAVHPDGRIDPLPHLRTPEGGWTGDFSRPGHHQPQRH